MSTCQEARGLSKAAAATERAPRDAQGARSSGCNLAVPANRPCLQPAFVGMTSRNGRKSYSPLPSPRADALALPTASGRSAPGALDTSAAQRRAEHAWLIFRRAPRAAAQSQQIFAHVRPTCGTSVPHVWHVVANVCHMGGTCVALLGTCWQTCCIFAAHVGTLWQISGTFVAHVGTFWHICGAPQAHLGTFWHIVLHSHRGNFNVRHMSSTC